METWPEAGLGGEVRGAAVELVSLGTCGALLGGEVRAGAAVVGLLGIVGVSKEHTYFDAA